jgi:hypothetical protein
VDALTAKSKAKTNDKVKMFLWGILTLIFGVAGLAFLVQGYVMQLATGVLYQGMIHYTIGLILSAIACEIHCKKYCCNC